MIVIIDYGLGNLGSIYNMLKFIGVPCKLSENIEDIKSAEKLILPGVGSFDKGMKNLEQKGYIDILNQKVLEEKTPILGICLGMQMMTRSSEEGKLDGLGWIDGRCSQFKFDDQENIKLKIPHMGWNSIIPAKTTNYFTPIDGNLRFYFAHSFHVNCPSDYVLASSYYGYDFTASIKIENILGVQFHPEKSHLFGINFFKAFVNN